jgi:hypothetical protein
MERGYHSILDYLCPFPSEEPILTDLDIYDNVYLLSTSDDDITTFLDDCDKMGNATLSEWTIFVFHCIIIIICGSWEKIMRYLTPAPLFVQPTYFELRQISVFLRSQREP